MTEMAANLKLLILCAVVLNSGCFGDRRESLGNGYSYVSTNSYNSSITLNSKVVVHTNVVECKVLGNLIVGKRVKSLRPDVGENLLTQGEYGYFVLNMENGELNDGLSSEDISTLKVR